VPLEMARNSRADKLDAAQEYGLRDCILCGSCAYVCPSHIPLVQYFEYAKGELADRRSSKQKQEYTKGLIESRKARVEEERLAKEAARAAKEAAKAAKAAAKAARDAEKAAAKAAKASAETATSDGTPSASSEEIH
jgi:Na+-translocating ferredoxin:NAD+ oxidoreductase subunit C